MEGESTEAIGVRAIELMTVGSRGPSRRPVHRELLNHEGEGRAVRLGRAGAGGRLAPNRSAGFAPPGRLMLIPQRRRHSNGSDRQPSDHTSR